MKQESDWQMMKKVGNLKPIARGADSTVHSLTRQGKPEPSSVVKLYDKTFGLSYIKDPKERKRVLEEYYGDTLKASKILEKDPNPLKQNIFIDGKNFNLKYKIVPQGKVMLENAEKDIENEEIVRTREVLFGQEFITGLNLNDFFVKDFNDSETKQLDVRQRSFVSKWFLSRDVDGMTRRLFAHLSELVGVHFTCHPMNIKPFVEEQEGDLLIIITDLAAGLADYYNKSAKFKAVDDTDML